MENLVISHIADELSQALSEAVDKVYEDLVGDTKFRNAPVVITLSDATDIMNTKFKEKITTQNFVLNPYRWREVIEADGRFEIGHLCGREGQGNDTIGLKTVKEN